MKVKCKVTKKVFNNGDFYIYGCSPIAPYPNELKLNNYWSFTIKGDLGWITEGKEYDLDIEEMATDRYGTSYKVIGCDSINCDDIENLNRDEAKAILTEITTNSQADNILEAYPNFIWIALTQGKDGIDVNKIYNVGEYRLNAYIRELNVKYKYLNIMNKFRQWKLDINECKLLSDRYNNEEGISRAFDLNPYEVLIETLQRKFEPSDGLIMELREDLRHTETRCAYVILNVLKRNEEDGSTRINANLVYNYILQEYTQAKDIEDLIVPTVTNNEDGLFYYNEETQDLAILSTYLAECRIADFVKDKIKNSHKFNIDYTQYKTIEDFTLSDAQLGLLKDFCEYDFMILSGYAGCGKTASVKNLIALMEDNNISYTLLSSTGKASKVLSESTGRKAYTIHKMCYSGDINTDCVIIDECGMVNLDTFIMFLNALSNPNAKIILCGDTAQLASIGLSKIFDDLIKSEKVPTTMLTEVFRYKSNGSLYVATNVRNGNRFFNDAEMVKYDNNVYSIGSNYKFIQSDNDNIINEIISQYQKLLSKGIKKKDIMVLSPFNKYDLGTYKINSLIQLEVNPPKPNEKILTRRIDNKTEIVFRTNDIVINTKNDYNAVSYENYKLMGEEEGLVENDVADSIVVNGQIGVIREVTDNGLIVQYDEELIYVSKHKLNNLLLGYSISTHKSQGSSVDYVISVVSNQHKRMLSRGLIYVADTRCRKSCIDIGDISAFEDALKIVDNDLRDTWLLDLMRQDCTK